MYVASQFGQLNRLTWDFGAFGMGRPIESNVKALGQGAATKHGDLDGHPSAHSHAQMVIIIFRPLVTRL